MKHSRNEGFSGALGTYSKRRNITNGDNVQIYDLNFQSVPIFALTSFLDIYTSRVNSVSYSCINNDPLVAETQFSELKCWVNEVIPECIREEMQEILLPILCHLYFEMLIGGHRSTAASFLKKNQGLSNDNELLEMLEELANTDNGDVEDAEILQYLRSKKYCVKLSSESLEILKQYLLNNSHIIMYQILTEWLEFEDEELGMDLSEQKEIASSTIEPFNGYCEPQVTDGDLVKLEEIIKLVKEVPSSSAPLLLYSVLNPESCMTCGRVSGDAFHLAAGFRTSEVKLWSLTDAKLRNSRPCPSSKVRLAVDLDESDNEEEKDNVLPSSDCITLRSHSGSVQDLAFMRKFNLLLTVSMDKTMRAWDLTNHSCQVTYRGHNYPIWSVDVCRGDQYVATGSHDRTARLWHLERSYPVRIFAGHVQDVDCVKFHPNGHYLATGSSDKSIRMWSLADGEMLRVLVSNREIYTLAFSPDGKYLASAGEEKRVKIWDIRESNVVTELKGHSSTILSLDWSPDGEFLASCSLDNTCRIWNVKNCASEENSSQPLVAMHNTNCKGLFSVKYSKQNTPMCVAGV